MEHYNIIRFDEIDSTNDYALQNLDTLPDRQVILAECQTAGHGRFKRRWVSHVPDNISLSLVLKPEIKLGDDSPLASLTQYMSLVICDVINTYGVETELKWPNDVLVTGKKISGLLSETMIQNGSLKGYVLGAGINLNMTAEDLAGIDQPATSLNLATGTPTDREAFLEGLLDRFFNGYDSFLKIGFPAIREAYTKKSRYLGKQITVSMPDSQVDGIAQGFADDGQLILTTGTGEEKKITAGDVILPQ